MMKRIKGIATGGCKSSTEFSNGDTVYICHGASYAPGDHAWLSESSNGEILTETGPVMRVCNKLRASRLNRRLRIR